MMGPAADQIALAIVMAARSYEENPLDVARGKIGLRSRHAAFVALTEAYPDAKKVGIARCLAYGAPASVQSNVKSARSASWWREDLVDEIVGALVAEDYSEGDEPEATQPEARPRRILPFATMHFDRDERQIIARMWNGGANPVSIGAAIGADADQIRLFAKDNPQLCAPEKGAA